MRLSPIVVAETICLISAVALVWKDKHAFWKVVTCYIAIALVTEQYAAYLSSKHIHNLWLFNIFLFFEIGTILFGLYHCIKTYIDPKPIFSIGFGIIGLSYFIFLITQPFTEANNLTIVVMSVIYALYCLYYYYLLLKDDQFIEIKSNPEFWWVTGVLFYYFGSTIANIFDGLFNVKVFGYANLRYCIYILLNYILYSLWIYSFICRMKQRKLQS